MRPRNAATREIALHPTPHLEAHGLAKPTLRCAPKALGIGRQHLPSGFNVWMTGASAARASDFAKRWMTLTENAWSNEPGSNGRASASTTLTRTGPRGARRGDDRSSGHGSIASRGERGGR
ncbi:Hypothetical protein A7982_07498 [Minicystis rosea]|nr:Hypothetical protein A7982_07498 [Minicystis rosea]